MIGHALVAVGILVGILAGLSAHELAHYGAARALGLSAGLEPPRLRAGRLRPLVLIPESGGWRRRVVAVAPVLVGLLVAPVVVAILLFPAIDPALPTPPRAVIGSVVVAWLLVVKPSRLDLQVAINNSTNNG